MANGLWTQYTSDLQKVEEQFQSGDRNLLEYVLGTGYYGVAAPVERALNAVVPDLGVGEFIGEQLQKTGIPQYIEENVPADVRRGLGEATGLLGVVPIGRAVGGIRSPEAKGMFTSSGDVYKKGHYDPTEVTTTQLENMIGGVIKGATGMSDTTASQAANVYRKGRGTAEFIASGLGRVGNLIFNPRARALYTEYGISPVYNEYFKRYQKALEKGDPAEIRSTIELAHSQMQQMANIKRQAGQVPKKYDATKDFALAAADPNVPMQYFNIAEQGPNWYQNTAARGALVRDVRPQDATFIQKHLQDAWGYDPKKTEVLVKTPRADITGNHFNDVLARNPAVTSIANVFDRGGALRIFDDVDTLKNSIQRVIDKETTYQVGPKKGQPKIDPVTNKPVKPPFRIKDVDDTGVWVVMGKAGTAKVEGGVNMLIKVETNGNLTGVMSDMHNFYEKARIPKTNIEIRNRAMEAALPTDVFAVTPPMQTNVVSISRTGKFGEFAEGMRLDQARTMPVPERARRTAAKRRIEEAGALRPSARETAIQSVPVAQNIALTQGMLSGPRELEDAPK